MVFDWLILCWLCWRVDWCRHLLFFRCRIHLPGEGDRGTQQSKTLPGGGREPPDQGTLQLLQPQPAVTRQQQLPHSSCTHRLVHQQQGQSSCRQAASAAAAWWSIRTTRQQSRWEKQQNSCCCCCWEQQGSWTKQQDSWCRTVDSCGERERRAADRSGTNGADCEETERFGRHQS